MSLTTVHGAILPLENKIDWVTPEMFGAIGDGIADDTAAFIAAANTKLNIRSKMDSTYKITAPITVPYFTSIRVYDFTGSKFIFTDSNNAFIKTLESTLPSGNTFVFDALINVSIKGLDVKGVVNRNSAYSAVARSCAVTMYYGSLVNAKIVGFCDGIKMYDQSSCINVYGDDLRDNVLSAYGDRCYANGVFGGSCAGDFILIKSTNSYFGNGSCINAGVFDTAPVDGASAVGGSLIAIGQDGSAANTYNNIIENFSCETHGCGGIAFAGSRNYVRNCSFGSFSDAQRSHVRTQAPIVYMAGTDNTIENCNAKYYRDGIEVHNGSINCIVKDIELFTQSPYGTFSLTTGGTTTNCLVDGITIFNPATKNDMFYMAASGTRLGTVRILNIKTAVGAGVYPLRFLVPMKIENLYVEGGGSSGNNANLVFIDANCEINNLTISNHLATGVIFSANVTHLPDNMTVTQVAGASGNSIRILGTGVRYGGQIRVMEGTVAPWVNAGSLTLSSYVGPAWSGVTGAVINYPDTQAHTIP